jgi:hypothetical protein
MSDDTQPASFATLDAALQAISEHEQAKASPHKLHLPFTRPSAPENDTTREAARKARAKRASRNLQATEARATAEV